MRVSSNGWLFILVCAGVSWPLAPAAQGLDFFEQKIEIHGSFEEQIRTISDDLNAHLDLTQWYHVLNIEMDLNIAPDGFGPVDSLTGFIRAEARYDCTWTRACGIAGSANIFGDRSRALPRGSRPRRTWALPASSSPGRLSSGSPEATSRRSRSIPRLRLP